MKFKHLAAGSALLLAGSASLAACGGAGHWGHLGPPALSAFGPADLLDPCRAEALSPRLPVAGAETDPLYGPFTIDLTTVRLYAGTRLLTADAAPAAFSFGAGGASGLAPLTAGSTADAASAPGPEVVAVLLAGFFGIGFGALRRSAP